MKTSLVCIFIFFLHLNPSFGCSAFLLSGPETIVVGKNFDMQAGNGLIVVNKRNLLKTAMASGNPKTWVSKYGSATFNWISRELPQGGINEAGLVVEVLMLKSARFPDPQDPGNTNKPTINELQWAQYQLDNYATTAEVLAHANELLIQQFAAPVHYFICDPSKQCVALDPIDGQYIIHSGSALPYNVLTNSTYANSAAYASPYLKAGTCSSIPTDYDSLNRFTRISCAANSSSLASTDLAAFAFVTLFGVRGVPGVGGATSSDQTQWSIVYDLLAKSVMLKTNTTTAAKQFVLSDFDFSCLKATKVLDINDSKTGNVGRDFIDYTDQIDQANLQLTQSKFPQLPAELIPLIVAAAGSSVCQEKTITDHVAVKQDEAW